MRLPFRRATRSLAALLLTTAMAAAVAGCAGTTATDSQGRPLLRLGYFPNITHAAAINGVESGIFATSLGDDATLETSTFNAGPEAIEALISGAIDATFIGPSPTINIYAMAADEGGAIRIVSGAASGGTFLVVSNDISSPADLRGRTLSSPQLGGTQDVALRSWLADQGFTTDAAGGGDVSIVPQENADILNAFKQGQIAGAWVPEPWATRLIQEGGGKVLVDERDLWPDGEYVTTHLIVSTRFLDAHPQAVERLIGGLVASVDDLKANPDAGRQKVNEGIGKVTGRPLPDEVITAAWPNLEFTVDPVASSLQTSADDAKRLGLLRRPDVDLKQPGIYDLQLLNEVRTASGKPEVKGLP